MRNKYSDDYDVEMKIVIKLQQTWKKRKKERFKLIKWNWEETKRRRNKKDKIILILNNYLIIESMSWQ